MSFELHKIFHSPKNVHLKALMYVPVMISKKEMFSESRDSKKWGIMLMSHDIRPQALETPWNGDFTKRTNVWPNIFLFYTWKIRIE